MDNEERRRRGRSGSRASSTSSLEVRCACQYYRSDSLLPERSALAAASRPAPRHTAQKMVQTPPAGRRQPVRCGDHEYEPIGTPAIHLAMSEHQASVRVVAPVVKITDTDVMMPVADSDDSIDDRCRFQQRALVLEGDVILPLDGRIEDNAMDGRNLGDQTIDTSGEELESPQELQDRLEERFQSAATPGGESRTDAEINTSQVDSSVIEELPLQRGARGLQQRLKSQAGKIRSRFRNIQKPTFAMPQSRGKTAEKPVTAKPPSSPRGAQKASKMERFRMALPERPRFSLPDKSKFHLPDKSKFHLPERPKFNLPDKSKFHIKKPNIQLPKSLGRPRRTASQRATQSREPSQASNADSTASSRRNIFDFSTYPRPKLFDRKAKSKAEYVTSSPKESRAQSTESSTFPRVKKGSLSLSARWAQRFGETHAYPDDMEAPVRSAPWRHPSLEEPRLSLKPQTSEEEEEEKLPWENTERRTYDAEDEAVPEEEDEKEISFTDNVGIKQSEFLVDKEPIKDPRQFDEQLLNRIASDEPKKKVRLVEQEPDEESIIDPEAEDDTTYHPKGLFDGSFPPVDPREFRDERARSVELSEDEESMRSDREIQQSSGSSCERRRRGVIEEIDSDEFFLREKGISQENMRFQLISEIRDAMRARNVLADEEPPQRPKRTRSLRKRKEESLESYEVTPPPEKPKRDRGSLRRSQESLGTQSPLERASSLSTHRIVYQMDSPATQHKDELASEPLDDIVVVKPARRKSKSSLRSQSQGRLSADEQNIVLAPMHPVTRSEIQISGPPVPCRRKRLRRDQSSSFSIRTVDSALCNGYGDTHSLRHSHERIPPTPPPTPPPLSRGILEDFDYIEPAAVPPPVAPKRTRSRTASLAPEDDRTSHGAESLPGDFGYAYDDDIPVIPRDHSSSREPSLPGYAVIEKREKPPRPPPPRRKRHDKFATAPRPSKSGPMRPQRAYSTLRPAKSDTIRKSTESMPYIDADYSLGHEEEEFHRDLRSGDVLIKMQGRPLPAPPRPPRHRRQLPTSPSPLPPRAISPDFSETVASTQTDPLPDDLVIEEEITTAKLVVTPSRSGSTQVLISTERVPSPSSGSLKSATSITPPIPPIPPLPDNLQQRDIERSHVAEMDESEHKMSSSEQFRQFDLAQLQMLRSALFSTDEPLRIPTLEVGDLKVERLTVSQLEAYKVAASEIDAIVVSATEMSSKGETEGGIHPSLLQELIAIRNQLEAVTAAQPPSRPQSAMEDACTATSNERIDLPLEEKKSTERRSFTRESSPLLFVQPSASEKEATVEMGRTVFPLSTSATDLTSDGSTVTEITTTILASETIEEEEEVITIVEPVTKEPATTADKSATTTAATITASPITEKTSSEPLTSELPVISSRSRSPSPSRSRAGFVRQTASPVKSLPPVISVTPDSITTPATQDNNMPLRHVTSSGVQPQRAVISYQSSKEETSSPSSPSPSRETSQSPPPPPSSPTRIPPKDPSQSSPPPTSQQSHTQFIAFSTSQIPPEFFSLANPPLSTTTQQQQQQQQQRRVVEVEPSVAEMTEQLLRALRQAGTRSLRHFVDSVVSRFSSRDEELGDEEKLRRVELAMCALLILIAGLIIVCICTPRTVTHHHHWDYFNPPQ